MAVLLLVVGPNLAASMPSSSLAPAIAGIGDRLEGRLVPATNRSAPRAAYHPPACSPLQHVPRRRRASSPALPPDGGKWRRMDTWEPSGYSRQLPTPPPSPSPSSPSPETPTPSKMWPTATQIGQKCTLQQVHGPTPAPSAPLMPVGPPAGPSLPLAGGPPLCCTPTGALPGPETTLAQQPHQAPLAGAPATLPEGSGPAAAVAVQGCRQGSPVTSGTPAAVSRPSDGSEGSAATVAQLRALLPPARGDERPAGREALMEALILLTTAHYYKYGIQQSRRR